MYIRQYPHVILLLLIFLLFIPVFCFSQNNYTLKNGNLEIAINAKGELVNLTNLQTGQNYAGGHPLWRLYFDTQAEKENEVTGENNIPAITKDKNSITLQYKTLKAAHQQVNMALELNIVLEDNKVRFCSKITNDKPHTIVRELQYPLVGDCQLPDDHKLLTSAGLGTLYANPRNTIFNLGTHGGMPYWAPDQYYRQMNLRYPVNHSTNCFVFPGEQQGLYFGSHDPSFQVTGHGLRLYPDGEGAFKLLEAGFYKYPNCFAGESWESDANIIAPYSGTWHQASRIYREWVDTWWNRKEPPQWVKEMKSFQQIIFRHQYGETLFRYSDLNDRIRKVGESVDCDAVLAFGWHHAGMDNGYPDYGADPLQGGDAAWKKAIADFQNNGGKLLLYFNGKLIDVESDYYRNGEGKEVCYRDNFGSEYTESYRFKGFGTFTGYYNSRSFVTADASNPKWQKVLLGYADIALNFGVNSIFYDQLGFAESATNWDVSREFSVPNLQVIADRAIVLKMINEYIKAKNEDFALGTEFFTDATACMVDYIHVVDNPFVANSFFDWVRYTFPEVIVSDRHIYNDTDIERRVNMTLLKGLRNDICVFRCRDLIDKTPIYQAYLAKINQLKDKYSHLLLMGTYRDTEGFAIDNENVEARCFTNGNQMAVVLTQCKNASETTALHVPGYWYRESSVVGEATVAGGTKVTLSKNGLAILVFEKN